VLNLRDKAKILDVLKGSMSLAEVGQHHGKNKSSMHNTVLNSVHSEQAWFFFSGSLLGTIYSWIPSVYCIRINRINEKSYDHQIICIKIFNESKLTHDF
jgi:hypothetical protein